MDGIVPFSVHKFKKCYAAGQLSDPKMHFGKKFALMCLVVSHFMIIHPKNVIYYQYFCQINSHPRSDITSFLFSDLPLKSCEFYKRFGLTHLYVM